MPSLLPSEQVRAQRLDAIQEERAVQVIHFMLEGQGLQSGRDQRESPDNLFAGYSVGQRWGLVRSGEVLKVRVSSKLVGPFHRAVKDPQGLNRIITNTIGHDIGRSRNHPLSSSRHPAWSPHGRMLHESLAGSPDSFCDAFRGGWLVLGDILYDTIEIIEGEGEPSNPQLSPRAWRSAWRLLLCSRTRLYRPRRLPS